MESKANDQVRALKVHLALNVRNVEQSIAFYQKMLGIEPGKVRHGYAKFDVQNPPLNLTLNEVAFKERGALSHLGIQVGSTDDVLAMRQKWEEPALSRATRCTNCCYATQDKTWVRDPDGNEWEAFVVLQDNLPETAACECGTRLAETQPETAADETRTNESVQAINSCCAPDPVSIAR